MSYATVYEVTCAGCDAHTTVLETVWPQTRLDPADGETTPEECPKCGKQFDALDRWQEIEPPEPEPPERW